MPTHQQTHDQEWVYGLHTVHALLKTEPDRVQELRLQRGRRDQRINRIRALAELQGLTIVVVARDELDALVDGQHQGVAALCTQGEVQDEHFLFALVENLSHSPLVLILDGVTDPHNLGACLRTADAAGVDVVVAPRDKSVGITTTVRKVACGAAETVPFVAVTNLARTLQRLQQLGLWIIGADGEADKTIYNQDLKGPLGLVLGAEGSGLRRLTKENCDALVCIPMQGSVSSLNVAVATGVCLYEAIRQRGAN